MAEIDWDLTMDTILSGKCILFLGPEVFTNQKGQKLEDRLLTYLELENDPNTRVYNDGLFFFRERQKRTETYLKIRRFFKEEDFPDAKALFQKLARIPFHFIINMTPDPVLAEEFKKLQIKVKSDFYWKKHRSEENQSVPTSRQPLIYSMLGSINLPESLVLTHDDLFDYFESIFQSQSIPENLKYHIVSESQSIIFLGIPFDRWYMQLLMRVLHLHKDEEFMRFAAAQELSEEIETLCKEEFKINFIPKKIHAFVDEIYSRCEQQGLLREGGKKQQSVLEQLRNLLARDKLEEAMTRFSTWLKETGDLGLEMLDDVTLLSNRHRRLNRKLTQGIISSEEAGLEANKIRKSLLDLLNEAKRYE